jgi:hypothetical protein
MSGGFTQMCPIILEWTAGRAFYYVGDKANGSPSPIISAALIYCEQHETVHIFERPLRMPIAEQQERESP